MNFDWKDFFKARISKDSFMGLPFTILIIFFLILLATFIGITAAVVNSAPIVKIDDGFAKFLYFHRSQSVAYAFYAITSLANQLTIIILLAVFLFYLFSKKETAFLYSLIVSVFGAELSVYLIKILINRTRPALDITYYVEKSQSFPSGHSTIAMAFFGFLTYYIIRHVPSRAGKYTTLLLGSLLIFLIGFSRLYLIVHFLSDVFGGFLIGALWLVAGITLREHHFYTSSIKKEKTQ